MFKYALCIMGLAAIVAPAFAAEWMTDLDAAKTKAAAENKAVLIDFTGSDWCGWCIKLRKEVLDTPGFENYAKDKFVLVEVDVPNAKDKLTPEQLKKNRELCEQYRIEGFPTIMVMNPQGDIIGGFSGGRPNLAAVTAPLDAALANGKLMAEASKQTGVERAKTLMKVYQAMPEDFDVACSQLRKEINALDPEGVTGIREIEAAENQMNDFFVKLSAAGQDPDKALAIANKAIETAMPQNKEQMLGIKAQILQSKMAIIAGKAETTADVLEIKNLMLQVADCMPADKQAAIRAQIEKQFADPAKVLEEIKAIRANAVPATRIQPAK